MYNNLQLSFVHAEVGPLTHMRVIHLLSVVGNSVGFYCQFLTLQLLSSIYAMFLVEDDEGFSI